MWPAPRAEGEVSMAILKLRNYVNGEWLEPAGNDWLDVENPATGGIIAQVPLSRPADVVAAIAAARAAFPSWAATPADRRVAPLFRLAALIRDNRESRSEEHTSELQSHSDLVCRLLLEKKNKQLHE